MFHRIKYLIFFNSVVKCCKWTLLDYRGPERIHSLKIQDLVQKHLQANW